MREEIFHSKLRCDLISNDHEGRHVFNHLLIRLKVDLTKYIEEHIFSFDNAFGHEADN